MTEIHTHHGFPADPRYWGPGAWYSIHLSAYNNIKDFPAYLKLMCNNLPCQTCRQHAIQYLLDHPIDNFIDNLDYFKYTVHFHNHVNKSNGKNIMSIDDAINIFKNTSTIHTSDTKNHQFGMSSVSSGISKFYKIHSTNHDYNHEYKKQMISYARK